MIRERVLELSLNEAVEIFDINKWKFFELDPESGIVRIEVPKGYQETYVVEVPFTNEAQYKQIYEKLTSQGFIKQATRIKRSF